VQTALMDVRFQGNNGHDADVTRCLLMTQSGHPDSALRKTTPRLSSGSVSPMGSERCPQDARPTGLELRGVANLDKLFERARRSCASF
jgi:hypothetical protein